MIVRFHNDNILLLNSSKRNFHLYEYNFIKINTSPRESGRVVIPRLTRRVQVTSPCIFIVIESTKYSISSQ